MFVLAMVTWSLLTGPPGLPSITPRMTDPIRCDALLFGGGIAGLWLLDELRRGGHAALLIEAHALGSGQTIASQGIIHGGLKYMFEGHLTAPARAIADMPPLWRACLAGQRQPDLSTVRVLSDACYIWGTGSIRSRLFLRGSRLALRAAPVVIDRREWPAALAQVAGRVLRVPEQVLDTLSLMQRLLERNRHSVLCLPGCRPTFHRDDRGNVRQVKLHVASDPSVELTIEPGILILTAGEGNERLRRAIGLAPGAMQRRPLHMLMARGPLPELFGHCVGGPKPRITVTTAADSQGRRIWQIGGQIAEDGVCMEPPQLAAHGRRELAECVPGLDVAKLELATYRVDRAEAATASGQRPDDVHLVREANVITAWPTKLALAPRLAERVLAQMPPSGRTPPVELPSAWPETWPARIAPPPWETATQWYRA